MTENIIESVGEFKKNFFEMRDEIGKVVVGHNQIIEFVLIALISDGHVLLEGVPGIGKTLLVKTLSAVLDLKYSRVQFTPDLMPADIIGTRVILENESGDRQFDFQQGPVFANIILADEINRASPKTQSALLEVMQEHSVTVAGMTYKIDSPYMVLATQNPVEMEGTYPLPEAEKDRFMFQLNVLYPDKNELVEIGRRMAGKKTHQVEKIADCATIKFMHEISHEVPLPELVEEFAVKLVMATHPGSSTSSSMVQRYVKYGASPRALISIIRAARIKALLAGRFNVSTEDILYVIHPCLRHRLILSFEAQAEGVKVDEIIDNVIEKYRNSVI